jgi:hypothetical protein
MVGGYPVGWRLRAAAILDRVVDRLPRKRYPGRLPQVVSLSRKEDGNMMAATHVVLLLIGYPVALAWGVGWKVLFPAIEAALFAGLVWRIDPATLRRVLLWWVWAMAVLAGLLSWYQAIADRSTAGLIGLAMAGGVALLRYVWGVQWSVRRAIPARTRVLSRR